MKRYNLKTDTMNGSDIQKVYNYCIDPRESKMNSDKGFVNIDNGEQIGTHWTIFYFKSIADSMNHAGSAKKSIYIDSFGRAADKNLIMTVTSQQFLTGLGHNSQLPAQSKRPESTAEPI